MSGHEWEKLTRAHKGATPMYDEWVCRRCTSYVLTRLGQHPEDNPVVDTGLTVKNTIEDCDTRIVKTIQND